MGNGASVVSERPGGKFEVKIRLSAFQRFGISAFHLELVVVDLTEGGCLLVFGDAAFEEVLLLLDVHHLSEPWEGVFHAGLERLQADVFEAAVCDVINVLAELIGAETDGIHRQAVADEVLLERDGFAHEVAELFFEFGRPDIFVLFDQIHDQVTEDFDVVGLVAQRVAEHLAEAGEFILAVEREHHAEEAVELSAFHTLTEEEEIFGKGLLVGGGGQIHVAAEGAGVADHEISLLLDGGDVFKHRLTLVRVDAERADHINEGVGVDVFLVGVTTEQELKLGSGDQLAGYVLDVVADDALCSGEIADRHFDDPALRIGKVATAPELNILLHRDVFRLPVIVLHRLVKIVGPLIFEWQDVKEHRVFTINDLLRIEGLFCFRLVEDEGFITDCVAFFHVVSE